MAENLLASTEGKYVLIKGGKILGIFDAEMDVVRQGYQQLGLIPFLGKQIVQIGAPIMFHRDL